MSESFQPDDRQPAPQGPAPAKQDPCVPPPAAPADDLLPIVIVFSNGDELSVKKRDDYNEPEAQKLMKAHKSDPIAPICTCRTDIFLPMAIAFFPREKKAAPSCGSSDEDAADAGAETATETEDKRRVYFRRDPKTSQLHKNCPNALTRRDRTRELRGDRKYPVSLFGPPRRRTKGQPFEVRNNGSRTGANLGNYASFCNVVLNRATHEAALLSGAPFGTPSPQTVFSCLAKEILAFKDLVDPSLNPLEAAEKKNCRLEFGLCDYPDFGRPLKGGDGGPFQLAVQVADTNGELRPSSYSMDATIFAAAAKQIQRHNFFLQPPFVWIGIISSDASIVRYWQWPAVVSLGKLLMKDSEPEADFATDALLIGKVVYKVRSIEDANKLLHLLVPEAGPLLSKCDFIIWDGRIATIGEVVKHGKDSELVSKTTEEIPPGSAQDPTSTSDSEKSAVQKRRYWRNLKKKEDQKGGYHDLEIPGRLEYRREDMGSQLGLWRNS
jgi:hypothetical protein